MTAPEHRRLRRLGAGAGAATVLAVLALVAIGCSGSSAGTTDASPVATTTVDLPKSYRFAPEAITVEAGVTVTWTNNDNFSHTVKLVGAEPLVMKPGERVEHRFDAPGTYPYECSFHPQDMQGSVVVISGS